MRKAGLSAHQKLPATSPSASRLKLNVNRLLASERHALERAEFEARMKDEFLAILSHELRTPLNAVFGWANILRTSDNPAEIAEGLEVIERNARAQTTIIDDLLDMSRIISGKVRLDVQRVDLLSVINSAIESVQPMAAAETNPPHLRARSPGQPGLG